MANESSPMVPKSEEGGRTGLIAGGIIITLLLSAGAFFGGYTLGHQNTAPAADVIDPIATLPEDAAHARNKALKGMSKEEVSAFKAVGHDALLAKLQELKKAKTDNQVSFAPKEDEESVKAIAKMMKKNQEDPQKICQFIGLDEDDECEKKLAKALKGDHVDHAKIATELLQGDFKESSLASAEAFRRRLSEISPVEPHHICMTGSHAKQVAEQVLLGQELEEFQMPSVLAPENRCPVWQHAVGQTLFTVSPRLPDRCAARFKVHSQSCDVLVHAHAGEDCEDLLKARMIADHPTFIVLQNASKMMECYTRRHTQARQHKLMPLTELELQPTVLPLDAGLDLRRSLAKALAGSRLRMRLRYAAKAPAAPMTGATGLRERLLDVESKDVMLEYMRRAEH